MWIDPNWIIAGATVVTAGATVVYVFGTFLLWLATRKAVQSTRDAFKLNLILALRERPPELGSRAPMIIGAISKARLREQIKRTFPEDYAEIFAELTKGDGENAPK